MATPELSKLFGLSLTTCQCQTRHTFQLHPSRFRRISGSKAQLTHCNELAELFSAPPMAIFVQSLHTPRHCRPVLQRILQETETWNVHNVSYNSIVHNEPLLVISSLLSHAVHSKRSSVFVKPVSSCKMQRAHICCIACTSGTVTVKAELAGMAIAPGAQQ